MAKLIKRKTTPKPGTKDEKCLLKTSDLPEVGKNEDIQNFVIDLDLAWQEEVRRNGKNAKYFRCIFKIFKFSIIKSIILIVLGTCS